MPRTLGDFAVFAAPGVFVLLWASGFVFTKLGLGYAEPFTFLSLRIAAVVVLLGIAIIFTRPKWPSATGMVHSAATGLMVHGLYLGGVFVAIENGVSAGLAALIVSLQPVLTSTIANRWLGERVAARQWLGLALGLLGVYLVLHEKTASGGATPFGWLVGDRGADRHHGGDALSEALRRRHGLAAGAVHPVCGGCDPVRVRRVRLRNARRALDAANFCSHSAGWCSLCRSARSGSTTT